MTETTPFSAILAHQKVATSDHRRMGMIWTLELNCASIIFLRQPVFFIHGKWITRNQVIKYVANIGSGVHSGTPQTEDEKRIASIRNSARFSTSSMSVIPQDAQIIRPHLVPALELNIDALRPGPLNFSISNQGSENRYTSPTPARTQQRRALMANDAWYRYVSAAERLNIEQTLEVRSNSGTTWYALERLDNWSDIRRLLALDDPPRTNRVGVFYSDELPKFDAVRQRAVQPQKLKNGTWVPGGGTEAATYQPHPLFGFSAVR
jgi:hypothetical protein